MKIKELIEKLKQYPDDTPVVLAQYPSYYGNTCDAKGNWYGRQERGIEKVSLGKNAVEIVY